MTLKAIAHIAIFVFIGLAKFIIKIESENNEANAFTSISHI